MPNSALLRKLAVFTDLDDEEVALFDEAMRDVRTTAGKSDIISEGDRPEHLHLIIQGWAARYKTLPNGVRQITAFSSRVIFAICTGRSSNRWTIPLLRLRPARLPG